VARSRTRSSEDGVEQVLRAIERGERAPVYFFHGDNTLVIDQAIAALRRVVVGDNEDFAYRAFRGEEASGADIVNAARTVPMLTSEQLIVVRNAEALDADDQAAVLPYLSAPNPATCLALVAAKFDSRTKLIAQANKLGMVHEAAAVSERELSGWVASRARARGLRMSPAVAQALAESTGSDAATVEDALERLALFMGDREEARVEDVEHVVSESRVRSVFELTDALGQRRIEAALRTLANMLRNREAPLRLLATLATHVRRLLMVKELERAGSGQPFALAQELGVPPFIVGKLTEQARHFSGQELRRALLRLARTDLELKSSRRPDVLILEEMILDLCLGAGGPYRPGSR
jgi:DNA polymerase III subunit delta